MTIPIVTRKDTTDQNQIYPEILYFAERISLRDSQLVFKKLLPDGKPTELSPRPSQKLNNHSPDGFQWGYGGSGPAQLALALLLDATTIPETALAFYQDFKWKFVETWRGGWSITRSEILLWIAEEQKQMLESMTAAHQN